MTNKVSMETLEVRNLEIEDKSKMVALLVQFCGNINNVANRAESMMYGLDPESREFEILGEATDKLCFASFNAANCVDRLKKGVENVKNFSKSDIIEKLHHRSILRWVEATNYSSLVSYIENTRKSLISSLNSFKTFRWKNHKKAREFFDKAIVNLDLAEEKLRGL